MIACYTTRIKDKEKSRRLICSTDKKTELSEWLSKVRSDYSFHCDVDQFYATQKTNTAVVRIVEPLPQHNNSATPSDGWKSEQFYLISDNIEANLHRDLKLSIAKGQLFSGTDEKDRLNTKLKETQKDKLRGRSCEIYKTKNPEQIRLFYWIFYKIITIRDQTGDDVTEEEAKKMAKDFNFKPYIQFTLSLSTETDDEEQDKKLNKHDKNTTEKDADEYSEKEGVDDPVPEDQEPPEGSSAGPTRSKFVDIQVVNQVIKDFKNVSLELGEKLKNDGGMTHKNVQDHLNLLRSLKTNISDDNYSSNPTKKYKYKYQNIEDLEKIKQKSEDILDQNMTDSKHKRLTLTEEFVDKMKLKNHIPDEEFKKSDRVHMYLFSVEALLGEIKRKLMKRRH